MAHTTELDFCSRRSEPREAWRVTYVTNRNASVILVPVAVYVGMGGPDDLSAEPFLLRGGQRWREGGVVLTTFKYPALVAQFF